VAQYVTLTLVPENSLSDFNLQLRDEGGHVLAESTSDGHQSFFGPLLVVSGAYIDFIQIPASRGMKLTARVTAASVNPLAPSYRLIVIGSTGYLPASDITGDHQVPLR
jgi:hypothetical protein